SRSSVAVSFFTIAATQSCSNRVMVCSALSEAGADEIVAAEVPGPPPLLQDTTEKIRATKTVRRNECFMTRPPFHMFCSGGVSCRRRHCYFRWSHMPPIPLHFVLCGRDLDWFRFCFFFLWQNDFQDTIFVLGRDLVAVDYCG